MHLCKHFLDADIVGLIDQIGSDGTAWLRLSLAVLLLLVVVRPRPSVFTWRSFGMCVVLGCVTAAITLFFMASLDRLALGTATALEFLGRQRAEFER